MFGGVLGGLGLTFFLIWFVLPQIEPLIPDWNPFMWIGVAFAAIYLLQAMETGVVNPFGGDTGRRNMPQDGGRRLGN